MAVVFGNGIAETVKSNHDIWLYPNPTTSTWKLAFGKQAPYGYTIKVTDVLGRVVHIQVNNDIIDASGLAKGIYHIDVYSGDMHQTVKAVRN